ncbi:hypothetical protein PUNSTDRAFT_129652 [Punctularia strigosozonata HHB-11173 SS5]|uniref:uncharacterized protein n=1 Tax=Punctularia strigosozonata (strain HHB-11173) TaxID=741275 RepID=UPI0004417698|nr:uncharacterized protein PUNSTDRAFT_129652 [Punctularia strigosozonata HHB-11173 SS5]EIN14002.1 hypothetical protein PUNSTDRAFT_129652 [Punctularia strigosozonata HHB-11173 SS5]
MHVAGGHKANINNPNTSDQSKEHSRQALSEIEESGFLDQPKHAKNPNNVAGGHKATLNNPNVSEGAKEHSKSVLEHDDIYGESNANTERDAMYERD